jgi:hypothetical protein
MPEALLLERSQHAGRAVDHHQLRRWPYSLDQTNLAFLSIGIVCTPCLTRLT